jgi:hypothetical protein
MKNTCPIWGASVRKLVPNAVDRKSRTGTVGSDGMVGPRKTPARNPDESLRIVGGIDVVVTRGPMP